MQVAFCFVCAYLRVCFVLFGVAGGLRASLCVVVCCSVLQSSLVFGVACGLWADLCVAVNVSML